MSTPFNPENYRFKAVIDWVTVRVTLANPSQFRHVQNRLLPVFEKLYVRACDGNDSSRRFEITFQEPAGPDAIMRGLQSALHREGAALKESDIQVIGLELALDLYSRTKDAESLAVAALHMAVHHAHPPRGQPRITKPGQYFTPSTRREIHQALVAGFTFHCGVKDSHYTTHTYVKRNDTVNGVPYAPLAQPQHRARFENHWRHQATPFKSLSEWRGFRFETLAERFALVTPTQATGLAALLQERNIQLGRTLDQASENVGNREAMAKSNRPSYRKKSTANTQRDTKTNQKISQALRNLTARSSVNPRKFGGFSDDDTATLRGECVKNGRSPKYLNTQTTELEVVEQDGTEQQVPNELFKPAPTPSVQRGPEGRASHAASKPPCRFAALGRLKRQTLTPLHRKPKTCSPSSEFFPFFKEMSHMPRKKITPVELEFIRVKMQELENEPALELDFDAPDFDLDFDFDFSPTAPAPQPVTSKTPARIAPTTGTIKISLRVPAHVLAAFKARAVNTGLPYQTLANRALSEAVMGFGAV